MERYFEPDSEIPEGCLVELGEHYLVIQDETGYDTYVTGRWIND